MAYFADNDTSGGLGKKTRRTHDGAHAAMHANKEIKILLVNGSMPEAPDIKAFLQLHVSPGFHVTAYDTPSEAMIFLQKNEVDVILLDFCAVEGEGVFRRIQTVSKDTPVIIFTGKNDHGLAMLVMRSGAEDCITREQFKMNPESLRDVIEFAIARREFDISSLQEALKGIRETGVLERMLSRKKGASELHAAEEKGATELKTSQEKGAAELRTAEERGAAELKSAQKENATELKRMHKARLDDVKDHKQAMSWMSGGYSIGSADRDGRDMGAWEAIAAELKMTQEERAAALKETQAGKAHTLKQYNWDRASDLKTKQIKEAETLRETQTE